MGYVFGPVSSRRLGRSLGVDVLPYKTCTYDCIYCQIGRTTLNTAERRAWAPLDAVLAELAEKLPSKPDYITLGGSGEPTLYAELGVLIQRIKALTDTPVAVLTNGSLLWQEAVRNELLDADLVIPSLDAGSEAQFGIVNRAVAGISFAQMLQGLVDFRKAFKGAYWLEILLVAGHTDSEEEIEKLVDCATRIGPDRIQLNTVTRPPADSGIHAVAPERLAEIARRFTPEAEVVAEFRGEKAAGAAQACGKEAILDTVQRHPSTIEDLVSGLGMERGEASRLVEEMLREGAISVKVIEGKAYYQGAV